MFQSARVKLTILYTLIIFLISGTVSVAFYNQASSIIQSEYERIERRWEMQEKNHMPPGFRGNFQPHFLPEDLQSARQHLLTQLLLINVGIIILTAGASYYLAGKTLKPIAKAMDEQKRFVADAAHELRTPLTALKTSLEVNLMSKKLSPQTQKILRENLADVSNLENLSESLLRLSRADGNNLQIETVHIKQVVEQVIKQLKPLAARKKIIFKINKIPQSLTIQADKNAITELLLIFVDNAIKYSKEGGKVWVKIEADTKQLNIIIKDNGVGIAKHHLSHIFDRFYRVDSARSKTSSGGYGLGLSVANKIADQLNGEIKVDSDLGKGTSFTIILPFV